MNDETVQQWLIKADHDLKIGKDELATEEPTTDLVCFHMQQCVEKYLKGFLVYQGREIAKTHDLAPILQQCLNIDAAFQQLTVSGIDELTEYAVHSRYPDDFYLPPVAETQHAVQLAEEVKQFVLKKLHAQGFTKETEHHDDNQHRHDQIEKC